MSKSINVAGYNLIMIDDSVLRYIPKKLHQYVTYADKEKVQGNTYNYRVGLEVGEDEVLFSADSVSELKWQAQNYIKTGKWFGKDY